METGTGTDNDHAQETKFILSIVGGFFITCAMAVFVAFYTDSSLTGLVCVVATVGFAAAVAYPVRQLWKSRGEKSEQIRRIRAVMYLSAAVGGAMIALHRTGTTDFVCNEEHDRLVCQFDQIGNDLVALAVSGLFFLVGGFWALVLEPFRHRVEDRENARARSRGRE